MPQTPNTQNVLEREVMRLIGESADSPDAFTNITSIRDSINDAIEEITVVTGSVKRDYTLPLHGGS